MIQSTNAGMIQDSFNSEVLHIGQSFQIGVISLNKETILQNKIIVALCERGCFAVNHTVGDFFTQYGGRISVGVPGESDIWGHRPDGRAFYVEVKLPGEKPRRNQLDFIEAMKKTGAIAGWCTTVPEALNIVFGGDNLGTT